MNGRISLSSEAEEVSNSRNVLFSPRQSSITTVEMDEMELRIGPLSAEEQAFFKAVRNGDKEAVQNLIHTKQVDVNCKNSNGETALQIAIEDEAIDIVQTLLKNKAEIGSALFHAVRKNSLQCVRILVAYDSNRKISTANGFNTLDRSPLATKRSSSGKFDEFLTPLGLAVLNGNYGIVEFLVSKGYKVEDPQTQKAQDAERNEKESMARLKYSLVKLNTYRALASPLYISHLFLHESKHWVLQNAEHAPSDPLLDSIVLKRKLKELARSEDEFRDDYRALSAQCENFAVQLLDECRNLEEIAAVMDMPELENMTEDAHLKGKQQRLRVLNFAIKNQNNKVSEVLGRGYAFQHCCTTFVDPTILERVAPMCVFVGRMLRTYRTFVQQNMLDKDGPVLNVLTLSDQLMLYNNVSWNFSHGFRFIIFDSKSQPGFLCLLCQSSVLVP